MNLRAIEREDHGQRRKAIQLYKKTVALDPDWPVPLYNLGLLFKRARMWRASLKYNRLATSLDRDNDAAWWNLGIAATALGRWRLARTAWRACGLDVPGGRGPIDFPCGFGPIRLNSDGDAEVVWAYRLDPARAVLASIPFPESGHRWGDVVLNDGAPRGYRLYEGQEVPVLDELQLLEPSPFGTYLTQVQMPAQRAYIVRLAQIASELEGSAEDWTTSIRLLCRACSEGRPHQDHDDEDVPPEGIHRIGIAARNREHAAQILFAWQSELEDIHVEWLDDALEPGT